MTPTTVVPDVDPVALPAPVGLLYFFLILTFLLHVLPMAMTLGGGFWALLAARMAPRRPALGVLATRLARALPIWTAAAITTGVAALLFLQVVYGQVFYAASVVMARPWLSVVALLIVGYYGYYFRSYRQERQPRGAFWAGALAWVAFLVVAFIYVNQMTLMLHPERHAALYHAAPGGTSWNWAEPTLWPRYLHAVVAALALSASGISAYGVLARRRGEAELGSEWLRFGAQGFLGAAMAQMVLGVWLLAALPEGGWRLFVGGNALGTQSLAAGLIATVAAGGFLLHAAASPNPGRSVGGSLGFVALVALSMIGMRDLVRRETLGEAVRFEAMAVQPQWGLVVAFLILLVGGLAAVLWMARASSVWSAPGGHPPRSS